MAARANNRTPTPGRPYVHHLLQPTPRPGLSEEGGWEKKMLDKAPDKYNFFANHPALAKTIAELAYKQVDQPIELEVLTSGNRWFWSYFKGSDTIVQFEGAY